uniref:VDE lipocalin domain-containing protein n=1 Tax=Micromonas pusilla TaxID=38833 RepID=A0A7S0KHQ0_MICPS
MALTCAAYAPVSVRRRPPSLRRATMAAPSPFAMRASASPHRRLSAAIVARASSEEATSTSSSARRRIVDAPSERDEEEERTYERRANNVGAKLRGGVAAFTAAAALSLSLPNAGWAIDARVVEAGKCLLSQCNVELAGCLADEKCAESLVCLQGCFGKPDEADCQIKCGDLYASKAVQTFNTCAVSNKNCVKQKQDTGEYPAPTLDAMAPNFDANVFGKAGRWYIVAGLNKDFDVFDCQEHFFSAPDKDHMYVKINWRVNRPNGQFYERSDVQTFYADDATSSIMHNNGNEYLHYQDDWYVPGYKDGEYVFVYYRGTNDAWDGYGGAVVYSTSPALKPEYVPELTEIAEKVGVKFSDFVVTDNSCKAQAPLKVTAVKDLDTLGDDVVAIEREVVKDEKALFSFVGKEGRLFAREVGKDSRLIAKEVGKDARLLEKEIEKDLELVSFGPRFTALKTNDTSDLPKVELTGKAKAEQAKAERLVNKVEANIGRIQDGQ